MNTGAPDLRLVESETEEPPVDPNIGITLDGRYLIDKQLGAGGMGLVYAATHVMLNKRLAVKVLKKDVSSDEQVMLRFRREAQAASSIGSPHICDVSDFGNLPDGSTYFVMEFLDGPPLGAALAEQSPMPSARIVDIGVQLCDALGAAHERGIVHRDLKPDNIHLVKQGNRVDFVKVLDFGIAKVGGAAGKKLTQAGQVFGTPHYMSPEQCSGREVDHRTDLYAVGVILYELSCGVVPFDADNLMGVLTKHVYEQPIPPREFPPPIEVPAGLEAIILKCLAKTPEARYQTMAELGADLKKVGQGATPDAVMQAVDGGRSVPRTQMIEADDVPSLVGVQPASPYAQSGLDHSVGMAIEPPPKKSKLPLVIGAFIVLCGLAVGAAALAFFLMPGDDPEPVADADPVEEIPLEAPPVEEAPVEEAPVEEAPVEEAPAEAEVVMIHVTSAPEGAEVYAADGSLLGNTPFDLPRPAAGEEALRVSLRLVGFQERSFTLASRSQPTLHVSLEPVRRQVAHRRRPVAAPQPEVRRMAPQPARRSRNSEIVSPW